MSSVFVLLFLGGVKKWDDILLGLPEIRVVTDHQALKTFMSKSHTGPRQIRWSQWLTRFRLTFLHVPGLTNRSADALSQQFESPNAKPSIDDYSMVDLLLDSEGDDLPSARLAEREVFHMAITTRRQKLRKAMESCTHEAQVMQPEDRTASTDLVQQDTEHPEADAPTNNITIGNSANKMPITPFTWGNEDNHPNIEQICHDAYATDKFFSKIWDQPTNYETSVVNSRLIYRSIDAETHVLCIPDAEFRGRKAIELAIDQAHRVIGHLGTCKTELYIHQFFWWPSMGKDVKSFCDSCSVCQVTKTSNEQPQGLLHTLPLPARPWSSIGMDFVGPFPLVDDFDYIWVVLCRLTSLVHLIPLCMTIMAAQLAPIFMSHIVRLHSLPDTIMSD